MNDKLLEWRLHAEQAEVQLEIQQEQQRQEPSSSSLPKPRHMYNGFAERFEA